jgi:nickel-dependent lactate racemase
MEDAPGLADAEMAQAIGASTGSPCLSQPARGRSDAVPIAEDTSGPAPRARVIVHVLNEVEAGGLSRGRIRLPVGSASHRPLRRSDLAEKLGQAGMEWDDHRSAT